MQVDPARRAGPARRSERELQPSSPLDLLEKLFPGTSSPGTLAALAAVGFLVAAIVVVLVLKTGGSRPASPAPGPPSPGPLPPPDTRQAPPPARLDAPTEPASVAPQPPPARRIPSLDEVHKAQAAGEFVEAARLWRHRGDLFGERSALRQGNDPGRLAEVELVLGDLAAAIAQYRVAVGQDPASAHHRLRLVQLLLDAGDYEGAVAASTDLGPLGGDHELVARLGRAFESAGNLERARELYGQASQGLPPEHEAHVRSLYLDELRRLLELPPRPPSSSPLDFLRQELGDSTPGFAPKSAAMADAPPPPRPSFARLQFDALVGHLALGAQRHEVEHSVKSAASVATRFRLTRLVGRGEMTAVFQGTDALLDYPVALRLARVDLDPVEHRVLRKRLQAISRLNHPNIAKLTYADRCGEVLRLAHDYQAGGTLASLIDENGRLSVAVGLRIAQQVASAIAAAHRNGILHGDLRPPNVLLGKDSMAKVTGFALQPWLVRGLEADETRTSPNARLRSQDVQGDILQVAELLDFIQQHMEMTDLLREKLGGYDPLAEFKDLVRSAQQGSFSAVSQMHKVILQVIEKATPSFG